MRKNTICLVMIVKNESKVIKRCLDRVKKHIDYWVIVDTGSTDNTPELIKEILSTVPGELHHRPWVNFGANRTESLQLAKKKADYLLLCDADEQIVFSPLFDANQLTQDAYLISYIGGTYTYSVPYLIKGDINWKYVGVTHEYLDADQVFQREKIQHINILDLKDGGAKADKYERDIALLEQGIIEEPQNSRYKFYLANSYRDIGNYEKAIEWYKKRIEDGGWVEEVSCSYEYLGKCYDALGNKELSLYYWLLGYDYNPSRIESLYLAVRLLRIQGNYQLSYRLALMAKNTPYPKHDILFIKSDIYDYLIDYELSITSYYAKDLKRGYECCRYVLLKKPANDAVVGTTIRNLKFYLDYAEGDCADYLKSMIEIISDYLSKYPDTDDEVGSTLAYLRELV